ncbi:hypothetical protein CALVIDRAFT_228840 [Calocera viscosa TUFC12733]|uniref:Nucleotidyltransferase family protein n=1 Tax=Calocera viscosa (strain TUFC12733) TaxID=1330018 RepID=A0A167K4X2_CALVF|nr:hypothetical protein CALVIDRAFT_228840 [Calocera viscosa TUFC12733]
MKFTMRLYLPREVQAFRRRPPIERCFLHCILKANVCIQPRFDLTAIGIGVQRNFDIVTQIVETGKLSLRDVQHLSATSKSVKVSLGEETEHRLRTALAPYFPAALVEIAAFLKEYRAVISGSTILSILVPGDWKPNDLDIVLSESSSAALENLLQSQGYVKDAERERQLPDAYPTEDGTPPTFRYGCFHKESLKIDLCYITEPSTPISHIFKYHSTAVMNYYDGFGVYCLFPEQTFAGQFFKNDNYPGPDRRRRIGLRKLETRGFVDGLDYISTILGGFAVANYRLENLPTVWRQMVRL